mmetsp:Transcript_19440/g.44085  ORF Transcript_19440/g.44085 Transcript_19440/m.44085 type:complete len:330 (+) Transcript_19440:376-1365(+)|eukprot:CAMPEP_0172622756 /NCGR_PEP_ID=MMETSP1068-20121228/123159_1 /TAXON_ID=35684 /ORGANISM="Pseudopedinella elastica, Strain CCMP716" /LENGTH=329 /DNA_ID=CAMNT_0013431049 /DNA_START=360 /DNA_END=1349 /DNA_ORIENTATION=-
MGKKRGKAPQEEAGETAAPKPTDFPPSQQPPAKPAAALPPPPSEQTMEELEARHKRERRELEGAARAARKAAGKSKPKVEEAEAAAAQALARLCAVHEREVRDLVHEREVRDLQGRSGPGGPETPETPDDSTGGPVGCAAADSGSDGCAGCVAGLKEGLQRGREEPPVSEHRVDPSDGRAYPLTSFLEEYGAEDGARRWAVAAPHGCGAGARAPAAKRPPPYLVLGSKKGGFPVTVESRARGKKVTVLHNVSGEVGALLGELKGAVGAGGVVRNGNVEVQGDHARQVGALLLKLGCVKGVSHANVAAATPAAKPAKAARSIARLDKKIP